MRNMPELPVYIDPNEDRQVQYDSEARLDDETYGSYQTHRGQNRTPGAVAAAAQRAGNLPNDALRFREV